MSDFTFIYRLKRIIKIELFFMSLLIVAILTSQVLAAPLPSDSVADSSGDAIGIKVMPNPEHNSPYAWYIRNAPNQGTPSTMIVDGYEAVRDGRTVYVGAANLDPAYNGNEADSNLYTNIYIISYNQDPDPGTADIFGQLLTFWKFNVSLVEKTGNGLCLPAKNTNCLENKNCANGDVCQNGACVRYCLLTSDCSKNQFCDSIKSRMIRDVKRMADLHEVNLAITQYYNKNKTYPILKSATYLPGKSISVWPSWRDNLAKELNIKIPIDPVNKLGPCTGFDSITCWNEQTKKFATNFTLPDVLPIGSLAYAYQYSKTDKDFQLCTNYETNFSGLDETNRCDNFKYIDRSSTPIIIFGSDDLSQNEGSFEAYFRVDAKYDLAKDGITIEPIDPKNWNNWATAGWDFGGHGILWYSDTSDNNVKKISAANVTLPASQPYAFYTFRVTAKDIHGNTGTTLAKIRICNPKTCGTNPDNCGQMPDNCGSILVCPDCTTGTCNDTTHTCQ